MHIYKFRILYEDNDQFFREIDVKANQTFEDFHNTLARSAGFDAKEMASFYICDSKWNKQQEICLCEMPMSEDESTAFDEEDEEGVQSKKQPVKVFCMNSTRLKDMIVDPHQRIIYVYDFLNLYTFYIELFKILPAETGKQYPHVAKSISRIVQTPAVANLSEKDVEEDKFKTEISDLLEEQNDDEVGDELFEGFYDDSAFN